MPNNGHILLPPYQKFDVSITSIAATETVKLQLLDETGTVLTSMEKAMDLWTVDPNYYIVDNGGAVWFFITSVYSNFPI